MDILAQRYWNKPVEDLTPPIPDPDPLTGLPKSDPDSFIGIESWMLRHPINETGVVG